MTHSDHNFDLIIIGGGLAGASLACSLMKLKSPRALKIAVVEAFELKSDTQPSYDDRTVALSYGSRCIFDGMGLWSALEPFAEAIDNIHISDRGHLGVTRLSKEQEGVEALGYVLENRAIGQQLFPLMEEAENISVFCPAEISSIEQPSSDASDSGSDPARANTQVCVEIKMDGQIKGQTLTLSAQLLVAADGNHSKVMQLLNIGSSKKSYQQSALVTNVTVSKKHNNVAYERFTDDGPLAFLPMSENRCSVVWTLPPEQAEKLIALDEENFLSQLQQRFGFRLGQIKKAGKRQIYPLFLQSATKTVAERVAVIGNAAHSVHPVAGQGFNLALRDVALLSELIAENLRSGNDIGESSVLHEYSIQREDDIKRVYRFTDLLVKTFSNAIVPLAHMRSLSLLLVDLLPDVKHQLAKQSMGLNGRLSRLGRGLDL